MQDEDKTKAQLIEELAELRQRFADMQSRLQLLEALETERGQAEEALKASEERYRSLFDSVPVGLYRTTPAGEILDANPALVQLLGYPDRETLLATNVVDLHLNIENRQQWQAMIEHDGVVRNFESQLRQRDGTVIWVRDTGRVVRDADGRVLRYDGSLEDITERKQAEETLRRYTDQLEALREVGLELTAQMDLDVLLHSIVSRAIELVRGIKGGLYLYRPEQDVLEWTVTIGPNIAPVGAILHRGQGLSGQVWETGETIIVDDYQHWEGHAAIYQDYPWTAVVGVPIRWGEKFLGVLNVLADAPRTFSEADAELLSLFATQAAIAIKNARLYEETQRQSERLAQTLTTSELLHRNLKLEELLEEIAQGAVGLGFRRAVINVYQPEEDLVIARAMAGLEGPDREALMGTAYHWSDFQTLMQDRFRVSRSYLIRHGEVDWEKDFQGVVVLSRREDPEPNYWHPEDMLLVPLWGSRGEPVGLLSVDEPADDLLPDLHTIQTLEAFANQAAVAIENARLYEAAKGLHEQALQDAETKARLLREVNHRVKNNLTAIIGLLYAEQRRAGLEEQPSYKDIMAELINRVQGLATVHSLLSASEWAPVRLSELVTEVIYAALRALPHDKRVSVDVTPSPIRVTSDQAHHLALVINELTTNTVKYGLSERDAGHITVHITLDDDTIRCEFRDDGPGYPGEVLELERHNVGLDLIRNIVFRSLRGDLSLGNDRGAVAVIQFKAQVR